MPARLLGFPVTATAQHRRGTAPGRPTLQADPRDPLRALRTALVIGLVSCALAWFRAAAWAPVALALCLAGYLFGG
jgi:hypothetical protein